MSRLETGQFYGEVRQRVSVAGAVLTRLRHPCARRLPLHTHGAPYYSLLLRGGYRERWNGGEIECQPMTLVFHPPETRHIDEVAAVGGSFFILELDPIWIDRLRGVPSVSMPRVSVLPSDASWLALQLYRSEPSELAVESVLLDLLGRTMQARPEQDQGNPPWLDRLLERLQAEFENPPSMDLLARDAGVHPVHLARVFRRRLGMTVARYVHHLRVEAAVRSMASAAPSTLSELALQTGFSDQSHFTRVFKRVTGSSPGALARLLRN
jgi:AraC family transcriptional regulator